MRFHDHLRRPRAAIIAATILRALVAVVAALVNGDDATFFWIDSASYIEPARALLSHGAYESAGAPELLRPPGYPLLLLPGLALGALVPITLALQIGASALTVWLAYRSARLLFEDERIALAAAWLLACDPLSMAFASKLLSETLATLLLFTAVYTLLCYLRTERAGVLAGSALALAATAFVRPVSSSSRPSGRVTPSRSCSSSCCCMPVMRSGRRRAGRAPSGPVFSWASRA